MTATTTPNPIAFLAALILAPLTIGLPAFFAIQLGTAANLPALALFAAFLIVATALGAPAYLTFGAVFLWKCISDPEGTDIPFAGIKAHTASMILIAPAILLAPADNKVWLIVGYFGLGLIFAPLWSAIFGSLCQRFSRNTRQRPAQHHHPNPAV